MAYTPTNWNTGDTITAEKLNKLEEGVKDLQYDLIVIEDGSVGGDVTVSAYGLSFEELYNKINSLEPVNIYMIYISTVSGSLYAKNLCDMVFTTDGDDENEGVVIRDSSGDHNFTYQNDDQTLYYSTPNASNSFECSYNSETKTYTFTLTH